MLQTSLTVVCQQHCSTFFRANYPFVFTEKYIVFFTANKSVLDRWHSRFLRAEYHPLSHTFVAVQFYWKFRFCRSANCERFVVVCEYFLSENVLELRRINFVHTDCMLINFRATNVRRWQTYDDDEQTTTVMNGRRRKWTNVKRTTVMNGRRRWTDDEDETTKTNRRWRWTNDERTTMMNRRQDEQTTMMKERRRWTDDEDKRTTIMSRRRSSFVHLRRLFVIVVVFNLHCYTSLYSTELFGLTMILLWRFHFLHISIAIFVRLLKFMNFSVILYIKRIIKCVTSLPRPLAG